jgi:predicted peroxiredoxin
VILTILLIADDAARGRAGLSVALAQAALGGTVRIYAHERAVALLTAALRPDDDVAALARAGLPDRLALLEMAHDQGIALIACQTGLAMTGTTMEALARGVEAGGLVSLLADPDPGSLLAF